MNKKPKMVREMTEKEKKILKKYMQDKEKRIWLAKANFHIFFSYYFERHASYKKFADFHKQWFQSISYDEKFVYIEGMRGIAKTLIRGVANIIWRIISNRNYYYVIVCYDQSGANGIATMIRNELSRNEAIISDFGRLYYQQKTRDGGYDEKTVSSFITSNGAKIQTFGMGTSIRGKIHNHPIQGACRPDFLLIDDIDTNENTKNQKIIKDDMDFIYTEVIGGLNQENNNIVWLGNIIRQDGRNVRQKTIAKQNNRWKIFSNFLYGQAQTTNGELCWDRYVLTKEEEKETKRGKTISVESLREIRGAGFSQNALGIPLVMGDVLFDKSLINFSDPNATLDYDKVVIGIDPAFSLKTGSDGLGICVIGKKEYGDNKWYILRAFSLYDKEKDEENVKKTITALYQEYNASRVIIENNNGGGIIQRILSRENIATETVSTTKDKVTRFLEIYGNFLRGDVYFTKGTTEPLIAQLEIFTGQDGGLDDIIDAMIVAMQEKQKGRFFK